MTGMSVFFYLAWIVGVFLFVSMTAEILIRRKHLRSFREKQTGPAMNLLQHRHIRSFGRYIGKQAAYAGVSWSFRSFLLHSCLCGACGGAIALIYLNNSAAAVPLACSCALVPWAYLTYFISKKQSLMERQLAEALQYFISEYGSLPNVVSALNSILPKIPYPLKSEIDYLIRDMNSGRALEDALFTFAARVNSNWAYRFAHILNLRIKRGVNISAMLFNLYMEINTMLVKEKERGMETIGVRLESYFLYMFIPAIYFLACKINPETHYILTGTPEGKRIMLITVLIFLAGIVATIRTGSAKIK